MLKPCLIFLFLLQSCAQFKKSQTPKVEEDLVTVKTALDQAQASYLRGCVEAFQEHKPGPSFTHCVERSKGHRLELDMIMNQPVEISK